MLVTLLVQVDHGPNLFSFRMRARPVGWIPCFSRNCLGLNLWVPFSYTGKLLSLRLGLSSWRAGLFPWLDVNGLRLETLKSPTQHTNSSINVNGLGWTCQLYIEAQPRKDLAQPMSTPTSGWERGVCIANYCHKENPINLPNIRVPIFWSYLMMNPQRNEKKGKKKKNGKEKIQVLN